MTRGGGGRTRGRGGIGGGSDLIGGVASGIAFSSATFAGGIGGVGATGGGAGGTGGRVNAGGGGGLTGAFGIGGRTGAAGIAAVTRAADPGGGGRGGDCVEPPYVGDGAGCVMRTVSRVGFGATRGGRVIRTVSFLGPFESLISRKKLPDEAC